MKINTKIFTLIVSLFMVAGFASIAYAATPVLSVTSTGSGDNVQIIVNGDSNSNVLLYYIGSGSGLQNTYIGTTNSSGYLSTTVSASTYGIISNSAVYVVVNNQISSSIIWPYNGQSTGSITFSQSNPTLSVGQTTTVYISGGSSSSYYISSNSNSTGVQATILGNVLSLYGLLNNRTAVITVCYSNSVCGSLTATVGNNYNGGNITLSQNNISLIPGQSASIPISGNGGYYFSNNTGQSIVSASVSGNNLVLYANNYGSANISICQSGGQCATAYVTVSTSGNQNNTGIGTLFLTFSQPNPTLSVGQSMTISISGGNYYGGGYTGLYYGGGYNNVYYASYNSDPNTVQTSISGNILTLTGKKNGSVVIVICDSISNCGPISVTVGSIYAYPLGYNNNYSGYVFTRFFTIGSTGEDVMALQQILTDQGLYSGSIGGNYGYLTAAAVRRYQAANGLLQTGNVGPSTRNILNNQSSPSLQE